LELFPSEFTAHTMQLPNRGVLAPFSFVDREYLLPIYDTEHPRVLMMFARQSEKSTTLGNKILTLSVLRHHFNSLVVTPSQQQTEVFSRDKLAAPLDLSERLNAYLDKRYDNVLFKKFITGSAVTLRYAFLHADRARGIPADALFLDEIQDLLTDVIPVIEECLTHSPFQLMHYSGTPKSLDNTLAHYWHKYSTMCEWMIPCDHCGGADYRYWNTIGYRNIGLKGLICVRCGGGLDKMNPSAEWVSQRSENWLRNPPDGIPFEGYRIPQPLTAWVKWDSILDKKNRYPLAQFHNEVLALGYDSGEKLLTQEVLQHQSVDACVMGNAHGYASRTTFYMGIDWGGGGGGSGEEETKKTRSISTQSSYTVVSIGGYMGGKFQYVYFQRFEGMEAHISELIPLIIKLVNKFNVKMIGTDYGGGLDKNDLLIRHFGVRRIARYQYVNTRKIYFNRDLHHWMVNRSEALMALVNAINRKDEILFPRWEDWEFPFAQDMLAVFREFDKSGNKMTIAKTPGTSDDTLHSALYCLLVSMIDHPRPDILAADQSK
jgi:hypothetical protein